MNPSAGPSVCLLVLNYNGQRHLTECLGSALEAAKKYGGRCPVVFVDNHSSEDDVEFVRGRFPAVEIVTMKKNDYLFSFNEAVASRREDVVVLLNNDMRFDPLFIGPLLDPFRDADVFAVTAKVLDWAGRVVTTGKRTAYFRNFWFYKQWDHTQDAECLTLDAGGGYAAFRRSMFLQLGGFDPLYHPGYCEDTDLSYRAWKRGWKVVYEPRSLIYHKINASFGQMLGPDNVTRLIRRNEVLFTVKNCGGWIFTTVYLALLPWRAAKNYFTGNAPLAHGILQSLTRIPRALAGRCAENGSARLPERVFLARLAGGKLDS